LALHKIPDTRGSADFAGGLYIDACIESAAMLVSFSDITKDKLHATVKPFVALASSTSRPKKVDEAY